MAYALRGDGVSIGGPRPGQTTMNAVGREHMTFLTGSSRSPGTHTPLLGSPHLSDGVYTCTCALCCGALQRLVPASSHLALSLVDALVSCLEDPADVRLDRRPPLHAPPTQHTPADARARPPIQLFRACTPRGAHENLAWQNPRAASPVGRATFRLTKGCRTLERT